MLLCVLLHAVVAYVVAKLFSLCCVLYVYCVSVVWLYVYCLSVVSLSSLLPLFCVLVCVVFVVWLVFCVQLLFKLCVVVFCVVDIVSCLFFRLCV